MKTPFLTLGALSLFTLNARAQDNAPTPQTPPTLAPATAELTKTTPTTSGGYQMMVEAGNLILSGENGSPLASEILAPEENLRRQREAVSRNAPALALVRLALQQPIQRPLAQNYGDLTLTDNGKFRELARQFVQESDVRFADGDFIGALDSRLDCLEMGAAVSRGPIISSLVGIAIEGIGRNKIEPIAAKIDAAQLLAAATRLRKIEALRPAYSTILRIEGQETLRLTLSALPDANARAEIMTPEGREKAKLSEKEARRALDNAPTPERVREDNVHLFSIATGAARVSPRLAAMVVYPHDLNPLTEMSSETLRNPRTRFVYERNVAQHRLLMAAFQLHAAKLDGEYPAEFAAPRDPFAPEQPLIYRREGDSFLLYSVGPDAKDNGGRAIPNHRTNFDAESGQPLSLKSRGFDANAKGDILAPVF